MYKTLFALVGIMLLVGTTAQADPTTDLQLFSSMNGVTAGEPGTIPDNWTNGYDAELHLGIPVVDATRGNVVEFEGVDYQKGDYGDILDPGDGSFSVSLWFKVEDEGVAAEHNELLAQDFEGGTNTGWLMYIYPPGTLPDHAPEGRIICGVHDGARAAVWRDFDLTDYGWHHLAMTFSNSFFGGTVKAYIDGLGSGDFGTANNWSPWGTHMTSGNPITNGTPTLLGRDQGETGRYAHRFDGKLDDFAMWSRVLSDQEVLDIYNGAEIVPVAIPGDTDGDNDVDADDAAQLAANWGASVSGGAANGDFNGDNLVNSADASILAANWTGPLAGEGNGATAVPEPSVIILMLGALVFIVTLRRK